MILYFRVCTLLRTEGAFRGSIQSLVEELFSIPASESRKLSAWLKSQAELFKARETLTGLKSTTFEQLISTSCEFPGNRARSRIWL
jgi:3-mercaptopyruvate sulfurtransferase SseA